MSVTTSYEHVVLLDGQPVISPSGMKLTQLVTEHLSHGWSPSELCFQHPRLSLGQVHSALAYYWDNKDAVDQLLDQVDTKVEAIRTSIPPSKLQQHLASQ